MDIYGLNERQVMICDLLWNCKDPEDVENLIENLDTKDQIDCRSLVIIMLQEAMENEYRDHARWAEAMKQSKEICKQFTLKG